MTLAERQSVVDEFQRVFWILFDAGTRKGAQRPIDRQGLWLLLALVDCEMRDRATVRQ